jgi:hypothetical protein
MLILYLSTQCLYYTSALNAYTSERVLGEGDPPPPDPPWAATQSRSDCFAHVIVPN